MKTVAFVLVCAFSLDAQMTTTLNRLPDGVAIGRSWEVRIRNSSQSSLVAYAVSAKVVRGGEGHGPHFFDPVYVDTAIDSTATPLLPNEEHAMMVGGEEP